MNKEDYGKKVREHIAAHWTGSKPCPICGKVAWVVADELAMVQVLSGPNIVLGGPYYPLIPVTCTTCGNTIFLNAKVVGVEAPDKDTSQLKHAEDAPSEVKEGKT